MSGIGERQRNHWNCGRANTVAAHLKLLERLLGIRFRCAGHCEVGTFQGRTNSSTTNHHAVEKRLSMVSSQKQKVAAIQPAWITSAPILLGSQFPSVVSRRIHYPKVRIFSDAVDGGDISPRRRKRY